MRRPGGYAAEATQDHDVELVGGQPADRFEKHDALGDLLHAFGLAGEGLQGDGVEGGFGQFGVAVGVGVRAMTVVRNTHQAKWRASLLARASFHRSHRMSKVSWTAVSRWSSLRKHWA